LKNDRIRIFATLAAALMVAPPGWALEMGIAPVQGLAFGKFVAGTGGTVTLSASGVRSASAGVALVPSGTGAAAQFSVTGDPSRTYAISLPANGAVLMTSGASSMAVNNFTGSPALNGQLSVGGTQSVSVGATLSVGSHQPRGSYSGTFDVTVNYN
jgi:hypothetical protein